jgi:ribonuclease R
VTEARTELVAVLDKRGKFLTATPFFERGGRLAVERDRRVEPGRLALVRVGQGRAKLLRLLGRPDVAADVIEALMVDRGLRRSFPPGVETAAREARDEVAAGSRRSLVDLPTFTIDPATAKDFDDAISAQRLDHDVWRIWVHIADVSAYVRPGSSVDREAYRRSTSVYVPGRVEPMLPQVLSNDVCSLRPGVERLAVTVEMDVHGWEIRKASFYRSLVASDERLDYDRVDRIFAGEEEALEPWTEPLHAARAAAHALGQRRTGGSALVIEGSEPEFAFDRAGHVTDASRSVQTESHRLIEHLMIAANEAVATLLDERKVPALYRVHERPQAASVERLVSQLASLGVPTPPVPERMSPQQAADLVGEISRMVDQHVRRTGHGRQALTSLVLRTLKQAHYSPVNTGHAGLGSPRYCHFTSPIRRYPDLVCHRALLSAVGGGEEAPRAAGLEEAGAWTSARERDAMTIERDADDVARCFLLERRLYEEGWETAFDGEVVGLIGAGAFVRFGDGYEGLVPVRRLRGGGHGGGWWELNEEGTILHSGGADAERALRLGDPIEVAVGRIDAPRGRVDLRPLAW